MKAIIAFFIGLFSIFNHSVNTPPVLQDISTSTAPKILLNLNPPVQNKTLTASSVPQVPQNVVSSATSTAAVPIPSFTLNPPKTGLNVTPGSSVPFTVTIPGGVNIQSVALVGPYAVQISSSNLSLPIVLTIPMDWSGPYAIQAFGKGPNNFIAISNKITLQVTSSATLSSLKFEENPLDDCIGEPLSLGDYITQEYADGTSISASHNPSSIAYKSSNTSFATVDSKGVVTAIAEGLTTISISESGVTATAPLDVILCQ